MAKFKEEVQEPKKRRPPATTPEARENQLISIAYDLAEKQLSEGTASSQVITHFLKLASTTERIEKEILEKKKELLQARTENMRSGKRIEDLYEGAIAAMKSYGGLRNDNGDNDNEDY